MDSQSSFFPSQGVGIGIRPQFFSEFMGKKPKSIDWVEALTENYLRWHNGLLPKSALVLETIRKEVPVALHGVSLSIASADPINLNYLSRLKELVDRISPLWVSDHLCWTGVQGKNTHDLLPFPYTKVFLNHVADKIERVQEFLKRPILLENLSSYVDFTHSEMTEWEFVAAVSRRSGCGILFDINNVYVSSQNHHFDPLDYLAGIPPERVGQIHLAGHQRTPDLIIDTHDDLVCPEVWKLFETWTQLHGNVSSMIEWDTKLPEWKILEKETKKIRKFQTKTYEKQHSNQNRELAEAIL